MAGDWWLVAGRRAVNMAEGMIARRETAGGGGAGKVMRGKGRKEELRGDRRIGERRLCGKNPQEPSQSSAIPVRASNVTISMWDNR